MFYDIYVSSPSQHTRLSQEPVPELSRAERGKRTEKKSSLMNVRVWQFSAKLWPHPSNQVVARANATPNAAAAEAPKTQNLLGWRKNLKNPWNVD